MKRIGISTAILNSTLLMIVMSGTARAQFRATVLENGSAWSAQENRLPYTAYGVAGGMDADDPIWFCGASNMLMKKAGGTWYNYSGGDYGTCTDPLYDVAVNYSNPDNVVAVGYDMIAITFDGGDTWRRQCFFGGTGTCVHYCAYENLFIYGRDNGNVTFGGTSNPPDGNWAGIYVSPVGSPVNDVTTIVKNVDSVTMIAVCQNGEIYYLDDYIDGYGETAEEATVSPSPSSPFVGVSATWYGQNGKCVAVTQSGEVYYSTNAGRNWYLSYYMNDYLSDITIRGSYAYVVGPDGCFARGDLDDLQDWYTISTGTSKDLFAISDDEYRFLQVGEVYPLFSPIGILDSIGATEVGATSSFELGLQSGTQEVQLLYTPTGTGAIHIDLFDLSGRVICRSDQYGNPGVEMTLNISTMLSSQGNVPAGVYFCSLEEEGSVLSDRFIYVR